MELVSKADRSRTVHITVDENNIHPTEGSVLERSDKTKYNPFQEDEPKRMYTRNTINRNNKNYKNKLSAEGVKAFR